MSRKKKPPRKKRRLMAKRAKWMRNGSQTFHEGCAQYVLSDLCKGLGITLKNQKIFYDKATRKWYIADFWIPEIRLVIEIDGPSHDTNQAYDEKRTVFLRSLGNRVIRFKNQEIETLDFRPAVLRVIKNQKESILPGQDYA